MRLDCEIRNEIKELKDYLKNTKLLTDKWLQKKALESHPEKIARIKELKAILKKRKQMRATMTYEEIETRITELEDIISKVKVTGLMNGGFFKGNMKCELNYWKEQLQLRRSENETK